VADPCEHGNKLSSSKEREKYFYHPLELVKKDTELIRKTRL
jgi:hypothetical protein